MLLPLNQTLSLMQTKWKSIIDPILSNPLNNGRVIENVKLSSGVNVINHGLGQSPNGWTISDIQGAAQIYRSAPFNPLTLTLTSNAVVTVNIEVF